MHPRDTTDDLEMITLPVGEPGQANTNLGSEIFVNLCVEVRIHYTF